MLVILLIGQAFLVDISYDAFVRFMLGRSRVSFGVLVLLPESTYHLLEDIVLRELPGNGESHPEGWLCYARRLPNEPNKQL